MWAICAICAIEPCGKQGYGNSQCEEKLHPEHPAEALGLADESADNGAKHGAEEGRETEH